MKLMMLTRFYFRLTGEIGQRFCSSVALRPIKKTAKHFREQHFVDWLRIRVVGGKGGNGAATFTRFFSNPLAGPDGGDGGNGGHVIFRVNRRLNSLGHLETEYKAKEGMRGETADCFGKSAEHMVIEIPVGTLVKDLSGKVVVDLDTDETTYIAARGGAGGKGNHYFLSNDLREPQFCEAGATGEDITYVLELKLIANIGLIGFPNAGKSTLLRAVSRARPKVAAYPFTTLNPHVGIIQFDDFVQMSVADLPGLIPGAHKNRGLGFSFLRHVERCACLLYVIDLSVEEPWQQLEVLKYEVEQYKSGLSDRFHAIVGNKIDLPQSVENFEKWKGKTDLPILPISAKVGRNVTELVKRLRNIYDQSVESSASQNEKK